MRKSAFCIWENKGADQLCSHCAADQRLCFATLKVQSLYFLTLKFQASSHLQWLCSLICVRPGWKHRRQLFSQRGSYVHVFLVYFSFYCAIYSAFYKKYSYWGSMNQEAMIYMNMIVCHVRPFSYFFLFNNKISFQIRNYSQINL